MYYQQKTYALLHALLNQYIEDDSSNSRESSNSSNISAVCRHLSLLEKDVDELDAWWSRTTGEDNKISLAERVSSSSDRVNLKTKEGSQSNILKHPLSGQERKIKPIKKLKASEVSELIERGFKLTRDPNKAEEYDKNDAERLFLWCWRFLPEKLAESGLLSLETAILSPAHSILPDCSLHGYSSTVSALTGAMYPEVDSNGSDASKNKTPYLLLFTFSPVQELIKASRKFLDFWGSSYLLHYLSAMLCWEVAKKYGADAIITPSLWGQEIIDALIVKDYPGFKESFVVSQNQSNNQDAEKKYNDPASKFENLDFTSLSLTTAGFPNVITVLAPSKEDAISLGNHLEDKLKNIWSKMSLEIRRKVKYKVRMLLVNDEKNDEEIEKMWSDISEYFKNSDSKALKEELKQYYQKGCWEWNQLWDVQINNTWQTYFVTIPLGNPENDLEILKGSDEDFNNWIKSQNEIVRVESDFPAAAETQTYPTINIGTWWGYTQGRLGSAIQAIKNTRQWQIAVAPGERSTLSGEFSALHPRFFYNKFQNGLGVTSESLRLFWQVMSIAFPGLFNGSEKLNAIELTKRMAWKYGGMAESLGINLDKSDKSDKSDKLNKPNKLDKSDDDYETLIRFPNLSSIAAAHFTANHPQKIEDFWQELRRKIYRELNSKHDEFCSRTRRPFQVKRADTALKSETKYDNGYNGVMLSSKWLADDMGLKETETVILRGIIDELQKKYFGDGSPADWWVLVLGDGDGMGRYVTGRQLKDYKDYLVTDLVNRDDIPNELWNKLLETKKRMGPATHVGLNRALLDFSNRLVPHITEQRFCGRVIYSGGDDVMVALPLADLMGFLRSLRAAWCGANDPEGKFSAEGGYWKWDAEEELPGDIPPRPLFTMGEGATMSLGIVIAHKSVPLPTVLENIWSAEKDKAKKLVGRVVKDKENPGNFIINIPDKDGLCFRVIYGSGNTLEAFLKGHLLESWYSFIKAYKEIDLSPLLYRLSEELPRHADVTENYHMFEKVAKVVLRSRDEKLTENAETALIKWLNEWEKWAWNAQQRVEEGEDKPLGTTPEDMAMLLRFSAFWVSRRREEMGWVQRDNRQSESQSESQPVR
jgi:CRISPR-associated protein Cmr2